MSGVEWTDAEREALATTLGCKPSAHDAACLTHNMPGNWGNRGHWMDESGAILDALTPFVAAREAEAWDDGFVAGHQAARSVNHEWPEMPRNPHRIERGES